MWLDFAIILIYFSSIMAIGVLARAKREVSSEEYFLSSRSLKWPAIAMSTIATNIHAGHFLGMAGSAYLYGMAQANFEVNAIFGILVATFIFVPLYLRARTTTITQFLELKLGAGAALIYSVLMILLYGFLYLGTALFWAAYAIDAVFADVVEFISDDTFTRMCVLFVFLGVFSAIYTYLGGLTAVVRTDMVQFVLLLIGGSLLTYLAVEELGGWSQLYNADLFAHALENTGRDTLMHLHLPFDHKVLPWIGLIGMNLLNLNYWGCNQIILQRALAAENLRQAQVGLLVGGILKYVMVLIIIVPGIALAGILGDNALADPDQAFPVLVKTLLPTGLLGLILCGLFASLMSSVDSIFNSVSTLWSIDIYKRHINPKADDQTVVRMGKMAILATLMSGLAFAAVVTYVKVEMSSGQFALTHWFNEASYYVKNGFVVLICAAVFLVKPPKRLVIATLLATIVITIASKLVFPDMNYLNRSTWVIIPSFLIVALPTIKMNGWRDPNQRLLEFSSKKVLQLGVVLAASLVLCHILFH